MQITIDKEFQDMIPPLSPAELELLENSIVGEGCRDSLVLWGDTLIDGHNRFEICQKHGIDFKTVCRDFDSRDDVLNWIDLNQLGRRNSTPDQLSLIRGRLYNRQKKQVVERDAPTGQFVPSGNIAEVIATASGVTGRTIKRDGAAEAILATRPDLARAVNSGEMKKKEALDIISPPKKQPILAGPDDISEAPGPETVTIPKDQYEEMQALIDESMENDKALEKLIDGNLDIAEAVKTIKQQTALIAVYKSQLVGKDNKINELIKSVKSKERQIAKLEKEAAGFRGYK